MTDLTGWGTAGHPVHESEDEWASPAVSLSPQRWGRTMTPYQRSPQPRRRSASAVAPTVFTPTEFATPDLGRRSSEPRVPPTTRGPPTRLGGILTRPLTAAYKPPRRSPPAKVTEFQPFQPATSNPRPAAPLSVAESLRPSSTVPAIGVRLMT